MTACFYGDDFSRGPRAFREALERLRVFSSFIVAQRITGINDVWQTTWDGAIEFSYNNTNGAINWATPGPISSADIVIDDEQLFQQMDGFGAAMTDSAALVLTNLKNANSTSYWSLLQYMFNSTDGADGAGLSYIRLPMGSTDLSATAYTYNDACCDTSLSQFSIDVTPSYVFSVLNDIKSVNNILKLHMIPWSPPAWMKDSGTLFSGSLSSAHINTLAHYLFKCVQAWGAKGFTAYAIGIQNEPQNVNPTYPTAIVTADQEAQVAMALRALLDKNGFSGVKIIGGETNWDSSEYAGTVLSEANSAISGSAWHCYAGDSSSQSAVTDTYPTKEIYFTECAGIIGSDRWTDIKWQTSNLWIGAVNNWARAALMWSLVANSDGSPVLPSTDTCRGGCRGVVSVSGASWSVNQEFLGMAQANKAILPKDPGGPWGQRIGVSVGGSLDWALVVSAFKTARLNSADWNRYSMVVLNWDDSSSTSWNPQSVSTTIEFRGYQAMYSFPVGVTTLWWFAPN
ncbi:glycoside hydrolase family 30 protein [Hydnum rufescens UP504]|uniref:Glycoside hydrolase family 30 protein n=1 Tax=Hydnum rufescens UP504 TaxID=1448309 RepID=A0A9P6DXG2_9AGAM|nr:glycoside hydrolase family 30 protein [Hydnum rufescens UP504]